MNPTPTNGRPHPVDERLSAWRDDLPGNEVEQRLRERMRRDWRGLATPPSAPNPLARLLTASRWKIAATLGLTGGLTAAIVAVVLLSAPPSVYAQAVAAVRAARTVHAMGALYNSSVETYSAEIWYDAERGVREEKSANGVMSVRLDDGEFEWVYRAAVNTVIKGHSRDPIGQVEELLRPLEAIDHFGARRMPDLDARLNGSASRAFVADRDGADPPKRFVFWLDEQTRLARFEEQIEADGVWTLDERIDMRYDVPISAERFAADFPADARMIDRTAALDAFALDDALATAERLGIVLAIHEVRRVDDDTVFVMSTSRPTPEVIERFGPIESQIKVYGEFRWFTNGRRLPDHTWLDGMNPVDLASWRRHGVDYQWVLLRDVKPHFQEGRWLPVGFNVYTRYEWQAAREAAGEPWWLWNELDVLTLDVPPEPEGLDAVLADVHMQTLVMGDATGGSSPWLQLQPQPFTPEMIEEAVANGTPREEAERMFFGPHSQPQDITLDAWKAQVKARLADEEARRAGHD